VNQQLWNLRQKVYENKDNKKYETLFTLANGYKGLRGALEFSSVGERGNLIAGIYDKSDAQVTEIVNCQDPLGFNVYLEDEKIDFDRCNILDFNRSLDMKKGILTLEATVETAKGKKVNIISERFVSRNNVHRWANKYVITPLNFTGKMFIENIIDGTAVNSATDPLIKTKHIEVEETYDFKPGIALRAKTLEKKTEIIEASTLISEGTNEIGFKLRKYGRFGEKAREVYETYLKSEKAYILYKLGTTFTSRDTKEDIASLCREELDSFKNEGYYLEKSRHIKVLENIWDDIDIEIKGDDKAQVAMRFNLYQLSCSAYDGDEKVSIGAKALHGEGYKGHIFWDTETFMLPFFVYTAPKVAKSLLMYRYNTLAGARLNAKSNGYEGAQFPWESADEGVETTPKWGFDYDGNPVRIWTGDEEYHINSDITIGIWEYYRATLDREFLSDYGLEIFLDTAKFWRSRVEYNLKEDRYEINKVIGPDEFHEHVNNNVFTNYLAKWSLEKSLELITRFKEEENDKFLQLCRKLELTEEDFKQWKVIEEKIYIPKSKDGILIEQFEGYFSLPDAVVTHHDENGMPLWPKLDGVKFNDTQLIKQADVVMLMLMLSEEFDDKTKMENYKYYEERTMHKSSLSPSMYSIMGLSIGDTRNSYKYFMKTILTDIDDNQGNTDFGLHAASTGGSFQSAIFGFGGMKVDKDLKLNFNPWIPENWSSMNFSIYWNGFKVKVNILTDKVKIISTGKLEIKVYGKDYTLDQNEEVSIKREL